MFPRHNYVQVQVRGLGLDLDLSLIFIENGLDLNILKCGGLGLYLNFFEKDLDLT